MHCAYLKIVTRTYCVFERCVHDMLWLCSTFVQTNVMSHFEKVLGLIVLVKTVSCTVIGLTYMDSLHLPPPNYPPGEDPCKPLYWYPRQIPDYCYARRVEPDPTTPKPIPVLPPVPVPPPPMPMPIPMPMPVPMFMPMPGPPLMMPGPQLPMQGPLLPMPGAPLPMPVPGFPGPVQSYPVPAPQMGLVPGVNGLVSPEGAINILPFSDVYSDLIEKHKQKMIRIRLQNLLDEYEYPRKGRRKCRRKYGCRY